jgi:hypothetical protein
VRRVASPVGEGRNRDIGVENDPKSLWQWSYSATPSRSRFSKFSKLPGRCREGGVFNTGCEAFRLWRCSWMMRLTSLGAMPSFPARRTP